MEKYPATIRISYDLLKQLLQLPEDVEVLGIHGIDDTGGAFPLIIETPVKHIKMSNLTLHYCSKKDGPTEFDGFGA